MANPPLPTHTFLKWRFLADFKKYAHTPPPPSVTACLHMEAKVVEIAEKCQNPESWHIMNVPERYACAPPYWRTPCRLGEKRNTCTSPAVLGELKWLCDACCLVQKRK